MTKYNNVKTMIGTMTFDSRGESQRYLVLKDHETAGTITDLQCQVSFPIIVNGVKVCVYRPDFTYHLESRLVVEDFKSKATITPTFNLKKKLMKAVHDIDVRCVFKPGEPL